MSDIATEKWLAQEDRRISLTIRTHGRALEDVQPCVDDSLVKPFCYTIGPFARPESQPRPAPSALLEGARDNGPASRAG